MTYLLLFWEFFKTGLLSIGGGLATLPFLQQMGAKYSWFSQAELANMLAVSESTPGPIGVNMATYAGCSVTGNVIGGIVATFGLVLPSVIVIVIISAFLAHFRQNRVVNRCFETIRPASVGLVAAAVLSVLKIALLDEKALAVFDWVHIPVWPYLALFALLGVARWKLQKLHPIVFIAVGAAGGILLNLWGIV